MQTPCYIVLLCFTYLRRWPCDPLFVGYLLRVRGHADRLHTHVHPCEQYNAKIRICRSHVARLLCESSPSTGCGIRGRNTSIPRLGRQTRACRHRDDGPRRRTTAVQQNDENITPYIILYTRVAAAERSTQSRRCNKNTWAEMRLDCLKYDIQIDKNISRAKNARCFVRNRSATT